MNPSVPSLLAVLVLPLVGCGTLSVQEFFTEPTATRAFSEVETACPFMDAIDLEIRIGLMSDERDGGVRRFEALDEVDRETQRVCEGFADVTERCDFATTNQDGEVTFRDPPGCLTRDEFQSQGSIACVEWNLALIDYVYGVPYARTLPDPTFFGPESVLVQGRSVSCR